MAVTINGNNTPTAGGVVYGDGSTYASTTAGSAGSVLYSAGASAPAFTAVGTSGQVLQSNGAAAPSWVTSGSSQWTTSGSNIYYTTGSASIGTTSVLTYGGGGSLKSLSIDAGTNTDALGFISLAGGGGGVDYNLGRINFGLSSNTTTAAAVISGLSSSAGGSTGGSMVFSTSPDISAGGVQIRLRIPAAGGVQAVTTISVGNATPSSSGAGITFPATQSASTNANTLDDYEEGTWTPNVGGTATYTAQDGTYVKIGRLVYAACDLQINVLGTGSNFQISGLPFVNGNVPTATPATVSYWATLAMAVSALYFRNDSGQAYLQSAVTTGNQTTATANAAVFGNGARVAVSITYYASA